MGKSLYVLWQVALIQTLSGNGHGCILASLEQHVVSLSMQHLLCILFSHLLQIISRYMGELFQNEGNDCLTSCDGADFQIAEHGKAFSTHKFKKSGLHYEVCLCILTGDIVSLGQWTIQMWLWPDIRIFQVSLLSHLELNECVEADDGYIGEHPRHIKCPKSFANLCETKHMQQHVRN